MQFDTSMTIRQVLDKALDQTGLIVDSFSQEPVIHNGTMRAVMQFHEQGKGCTNGSKIVFSEVEFVLHAVSNPVILDDATTGSNEAMFSHHLPNRKIVSSRARAAWRCERNLNTVSYGVEGLGYCGQDLGLPSKFELFEIVVVCSIRVW